jgi:hypothetical protein
VERSTSTAPGTCFTSAITWSASRFSVPMSGPRSSSWICFCAPKPPVASDAVTPPTRVASRRISSATTSWLRSRSALGCSRTYTSPWFTVPWRPPTVV